MWKISFLLILIAVSIISAQIFEYHNEGSRVILSIDVSDFEYNAATVVIEYDTLMLHPLCDVSMLIDDKVIAQLLPTERSTIIFMRREFASTDLNCKAIISPDSLNDEPETNIITENIEISQVLNIDETSNIEKCEIIIKPNPFSDYTIIGMAGEFSKSNTIQIFDLMGNLVNQITSDENFIWHGTDDSGKSLSNGVYFLRISNDISDEFHKLYFIR